MAYIYVITNKINGKQYVGKTNYNDPQKRFKEHFREFRRERNENRPVLSTIKTSEKRLTVGSKIRQTSNLAPLKGKPKRETVVS